MLDCDLAQSLNKYLDDNWDAMVADIRRLVEIDSVEDKGRVTPDEPYGPGPAKALEEALRMWDEYGFVSCNCEGRIGYADLPSESDVQIGIIGHVDVVPVGQGWSFPPFQVTQKDGYLIGRGVSDDKGPLVMALHAAKFWMNQGRKFPYSLRFIIGNNEETGMNDLAYYQERFDDPDLLFSPDDEFPVCYGEKGVYQGSITSSPIIGGVIVEWEAGIACNAVPGIARAVLSAECPSLPDAPKDIDVTILDSGQIELVAHGVQAHASTPEEGESALAKLVDFLLASSVCSGEERAWLELTHDICANCDGSGIGIQNECPDFGCLTLVGGVAGKVGDRLTQTVDIRFVTGNSSDQLTGVLEARVEQIGATFEPTHVMPLFAMDKEGDLVQTLLGSYRDVTGDMQDAFTIGGATYSRHFKNGVGFGVDVHGEKRPSWVGGMHAADEGVSEESLKNAFKTYAVAIDRLMKLDLPK